MVLKFLRQFLKSQHHHLGSKVSKKKVKGRDLHQDLKVKVRNLHHLQGSKVKKWVRVIVQHFQQGPNDK